MSAVRRGVGVMVGLVGVIVGTMVSALLGAAPASAQTVDCSASIVDPDGLLSRESVAARIAEVDQVRVMVVAYASLADGSLSDAVDELVAACVEEEGPTWDDDLAIISVAAAERSSDVYFGPLVSSISNPRAVRESASEQFGEGDFTGGVNTAIDLLAADIEFAASAPAPGDEPPSSRDADGAGGDEGGNVGALRLGALALVGAIGAGGVYGWRRRSLGELREAFEAEVAAPRLRVGAAREQGLRAEADADLWARVSAGRTLTVLHEKRKQVRDAGKAMEGAASLVGASTPDGIAKASSGQLADARRRLADLTTTLDGYELALAELLAFGAHIDRLRVALPAKRRLLIDEVEAAEKLADRRRSEGWRVDDAVAELAAVRAMVQPLEFYELALDHLSLSGRVELAEAKLFAADHELQSMPDRPGSLTTWRSEQAKAVAAEEERSRTVESKLVELQVRHAQESWAWAASHPDRAREHLAGALAIAREIEPLVEAQAFDDAGRALDRAGMELIAADTLLDELDDLIVDLEQAKIEAPGILAESLQVLGQFTTFVANYSGDLDGDLLAQPDLIDRSLTGLADELATERPNYLRVAETAEHVNRQLDELLIEAQEQHQAMEALRRQSAREVARAQRNLRRARTSLGWELFESDDSRAIERLSMALDRLPAELGARVDAAARIADDALVIQERIIARRRRNSNWVVVGGAHRSGGSGAVASWGGSGSSISFGGGGGGGSRSFGGGRSSGNW